MNGKPYNTNIDLLSTWLDRNFYFMIFHNTFKYTGQIYRSELRILQSLYQLLLHHTKANCICEKIKIHPVDYLLHKTRDNNWEFRCRRCHAMELLETIVLNNSVDMFKVVQKLPSIIEYKCSYGIQHKLEACNKCQFDEVIRYYLSHDIISRILDIKEKEMRTQHDAVQIGNQW